MLLAHPAVGVVVLGEPGQQFGIDLVEQRLEDGVARGGRLLEPLAAGEPLADVVARAVGRAHAEQPALLVVLHQRPAVGGGQLDRVLDGDLDEFMQTALAQMDQYIPIEQRQQSVPLAATIAAVEAALADGMDDTHELQQRIRRAVGKWVNTTHRRRPMIIPVVVEA